MCCTDQLLVACKAIFVSKRNSGDEMHKGPILK